MVGNNVYASEFTSHTKNFRPKFQVIGVCVCVMCVCVCVWCVCGFFRLFSTFSTKNIGRPAVSMAGQATMWGGRYIYGGPLTEDSRIRNLDVPRCIDQYLLVLGNA